MVSFVQEWDPLIMGYFDTLDNGPLNKYKKNLKNEKKFIDVFFNISIDCHSNLIQFHYCLIVNQRPLN
jgi:DAD family